MLRIPLLGAAAALSLTILLAAGSGDSSSLPQYDKTGHLLRPADYREWVFLSSGLGMTYSQSMGDPMFTNVFVPKWAYEEFLKDGKWPDKTTFVVEERSSASKGSINKAGRFQTDFEGMGVEVKDSRFPEQWAYFNFGEQDKSAEANPKEACWQCHEDHAAVEHSFVQFYPTLKPVAKKFGTYKESAEKIAQ